jgi:glycosyltransferase involved in cell wall biosynthesis
MNNLFLGILHRDNDIDWLTKYSKTSIQVAANNFQWSFIRGLETNLNESIDIISTLSMGSFPKSSRKLLVRSRNIKHNKESIFQYLGYVNFYFIKGFCRSFNLFIELRKWIKNNPKGGTLYVYSLYSPYLWALNFLKNIRHKNNIKYCLIIPDLMGKYGMLSPWYTISGIWRRIDSFFLYKLSHQADCYVFLTKYMSEPMNIGIKPYTVIEGLISTTTKISNVHYSVLNEMPLITNVILYTGSLLKDFGIEMLLKAFLKIEDENYELWICGPYNESKTVQKYAKIDQRIKYLGFLQKDAVAKLQQKATVLINPRPNIGEYVKYSFPSKTMEYLLSGIPVIMFKLDGIPDDYYEHIYFIEKYNANSIAQKMIEICNKSRGELSDFGKKAKMFIINKKDCTSQTKKVIDMLSLL